MEVSGLLIFEQYVKVTGNKAKELRCLGICGRYMQMGFIDESEAEDAGDKVIAVVLSSDDQAVLDQL